MRRVSGAVGLRLTAAGGGLALLASLGVALGYAKRGEERAPPPPGVSAATPAAMPERLGEIPADAWIGAPEGGLSGESLRGRVVLVEFWTFLCYNCKNVEPWMKSVHARYAGRGLQVIGVHTPEFEQERDVGRVRAYLAENGIDWPVAIDNGLRAWRRYNRTNAWPAFLVFDREGELVYRRAGERAVTGAEQAIRRALAEASG